MVTLRNSENIIFCPEEKCDLLPADNFGKIVWNSLRNRSPEEAFYIDAVTKEVLTCGQLLEQSIKLAIILKDMGMQKGDVISIVSGNNLYCTAPQVAALYLGVAVNPVNPEFLKTEMKHFFQLSKPKIIFSIARSLETVLEVTEELKFIEKVFSIGPTTENGFDLKSLKHLILECEKGINAFTPEDYDYKTEVAIIILSSGTTGLPKGVTLTHQNLRYPNILFWDRKYGNVTKDDVTIVIPPYFHIFGQILQFLTLTSGIKTIIMEKFEPTLFLRCIEEYRVTKLHLVPPILVFLTKNPLRKSYDISSIKEIYVGAAPLGRETLEESGKILKGVHVKQMYGLSETSGPFTIQLDPNKKGSVGCLISGTIAKVTKLSSKKAVGPLEKGEICVKGSMLMKGYIPNQNFVDNDGFLPTGDIGYYDNDNYFYVVDRIKDIIKYKAFQIAPAELESIIVTYPHVQDCAVIGIPNERVGELPLGLVVLKEGSCCKEEDIVDFVAKRVSTLHGGVRFIKEIPKNPSGKILRRKLAEMFQEMKST